jgi:putative chitinase
MDRKPIFDAVRRMLGRGFTQAEVKALDAAIDTALITVPAPEPDKSALRDEAAFFAGTRLVTGPLDQGQVDTIKGLLAKAAHWPLSWVAYALATAWHEARFRHDREIGLGKGKVYGRAGARSNKTIGPTYGGQIPYGRGLTQVTWCDNYEWADAELAKARLIAPGELLANFDLALRPDISVFLLVRGMETGAFTGRKLAHYLPERLGTPAQYRECRRIINGLDKADLVAGYAERFEAALSAGGWG